jgi:hypothetical protein
MRFCTQIYRDLYRNKYSLINSFNKLWFDMKDKAMREDNSFLKIGNKILIKSQKVGNDYFWLQKNLNKKQ